MYVRTYVQVGHAWECQFPVSLSQFEVTLGMLARLGRFLATEDGKDSAAGPLQRMYLQNQGQVHKQVLNAADGW